MAKTQEESNTNERIPWNVSKASIKTWNRRIILIIGIIIILVILRITLGSILSVAPMTTARMLSFSESDEAFELEEASEPEEAYLPDPTQEPNPTATTMLEPGEVTDRSINN